MTDQSKIKGWVIEWIDDDYQTQREEIGEGWTYPMLYARLKELEQQGQHPRHWAIK